ncbi:MAG: MerR family transcriptional regulator [Bacteroidales bacterium]|nr:MerR family transcriptional regulator [Bacteroidales bacterium]
MEDKLFYSIGEVAKEFDLNYSTLRYWEEEFAMLKPQRNKRGVRLYRKEDVELIRQIVYLTREKKMTISGAKQAIRGEKYKDADYTEVLDTLMHAKRFLTELKSKLKE